MRFGRFVASALVAGAGVVLAGCVAQPPAVQTSVSPSIAAVTGAPSALANWQWSDAGPAVFINAAEVTAAGDPTASLSLICNNAAPSIMITWDSSVASAGLSGLTYRFDNQPVHDVSTPSSGQLTQFVSDPLVVSRFIDEAANSHQLVLTSGAARATFATTDDSGNLTRFRTACPDGTN